MDRFFLLFLFLFPATILLGQAPESGEQWYFEQLTIDDRLSHNTVYCLLRDRQGYLWIGTQDGLNQYDGYDFLVYRSPQLSQPDQGFVGRTISSLLEDQAGNLWVGTRNFGVNLRAAGSDQFEHLQADSAFVGIEGVDITALYEDRSGHIWIATGGKGLLCFDPMTRQSRLYDGANSGLSSDWVFDVIEDSLGGIWAATAGLGLNYLGDDDQFSMGVSLIDGQPNLAGYRKSLALDGHSLWVGTEGSGLYRVDLMTGTYEQVLHEGSQPALPSNGIRDLQLRSNGQLLIAIDKGGLAHYDPQLDSLWIAGHQPSLYGSLNTNSLLSVLEDSSGTVWIGTYNGGINVFFPAQTNFEFATPASQFQSSSILSVAQGQQGQLWIGTDGGGCYTYFPASRSFVPLEFSTQGRSPQASSNLVVKSLLEDSRGHLWIGTFSRGLLRYDPSTKEVRQYRETFENPRSLGGNNVWSMTEDRQGRIWIATLGGGMSVWHPETDDFSVYPPHRTPNQPLMEADIMVVFIDRQARIWIGTGDLGLILWESETGPYRQFRHEPTDTTSLSSNEIRSIFQDAAGTIWIGTEGGGLNRWVEGGSFERMAHLHSPSGAIVMSMTQDQAGMLWLATFSGIHRLNPRTGEETFFDFREKTNSNQFNQLAAVAAQDGKLYFGGIKGLHMIHPQQVQTKTEYSKLMFTELRIFNQEVPVGPLEDGHTILSTSIEHADPIQLRYDDNSFSLAFASHDFSRPGKNQFRYYMEGFDTYWQTTNPGQHRVTYTNLAPGSYTFRLQHQGQEAQKRIVISPPFWQRGWFRALVIVASLGLIFSVLFLIVKRRESMHQQQMLKAQQEILTLKNENLATHVKNQNAKLMFSSVQMAHKNEALTKIKEALQSLPTDSLQQRRNIVRMLDQELKGENYWSEFNLYFNEVDQAFVQQLKNRHPKLTQNDLRLCALIRLNLTTKEIASLLNISVRGVEQSRYRLKKRLELDAETNLVDYITDY
jgi:ligand-binding sensor domain-containing protein/DNA-binding CsgD family transcriptional regulator